MFRQQQRQYQTMFAICHSVNSGFFSCSLRLLLLLLYVGLATEPEILFAQMSHNTFRKSNHPCLYCGCCVCALHHLSNIVQRVYILITNLNRLHFFVCYRCNSIPCILVVDLLNSILVAFRVIFFSNGENWRHSRLLLLVLWVVLRS